MSKPKNPPITGAKKTKKPAATARPILTGSDALAVLKSDSPKKALAEVVASATPPKLAKSPQEEDLVVFAFRLSREERDQIHAATGPARASKFVRGLAVAGARGDEKAIREILNGLDLPPAA